VHDSGKGESDCKAILDKRLAGGTGGLSTLKFSKLCSAMQKKYGANPLDEVAEPAIASIDAVAVAEDAGPEEEPLAPPEVEPEWSESEEEEEEEEDDEEDAADSSDDDDISEAELAKDKNWEDLTYDEQQAAVQLGWEEHIWDHGEVPEQLEGCAWGTLTDEQQAWGETLDYDQANWDWVVGAEGSEYDPQADAASGSESEDASSSESESESSEEEVEEEDTVVEAQALDDSGIDPNDFFTPRTATLTPGKDDAPAAWWHGDGTYESYSDEEEKSYKYTFTTGDDGMVEIKRLGGEIMDDGSITEPVDEGTAFYDGNTLTAQVFGAEYTAELSSDGSSITWSDGDEWSFVAARRQATKPRRRQQQQRSAGPLKTSAMTADALKEKLAISSGIKAPTASEIAATVASVTFTEAKASPLGASPRFALPTDYKFQPPNPTAFAFSPRPSEVADTTSKPATATISTAGNTSKPAATNSKVEAPKSVFNFSNPIAPTTSTPEIKSEASKGVNLTATLWLSKPAAVEPAASEEELVNPAAAVEEEEPAPAAEEEAPAPPSPVREASDGTAVPEAYDAQVKCLVSFYAVHDSGKGESDCKAILDKRLAGATGALGTLEFSKLCRALQKKYGANPLEGAKPTGALLSSSSHLIFSNLCGGLYGKRYGRGVYNKVTCRTLQRRSSRPKLLGQGCRSRRPSSTTRARVRRVRYLERRLCVRPRRSPHRSRARRSGARQHRRSDSASTFPRSRQAWCFSLAAQRRRARRFSLAGLVHKTRRRSPTRCHRRARQRRRRRPRARG
jgi:hypothetical protein